ncbi:beta-lactamase family protein [Chitinophaga sp. Mgbs1]|uniref:Beta-lactamase family protein n=1 Tax=Chitinophaga solisilvae TaxID=1233460 RepID=A0A9Q5D2P0_9BACT|nr:beta-lactamase family protein [Chitinophaga solisilvae]
MRNYCVALLLLLAAGACRKKDSGDTVPVPSQDTARITQQITVLLNEVRIPGIAVAVVGPEGIIWSQTAGMADVEKKIPITAKTVFKLGSMAKPFIAFSVMQLVQSGKLSLDANVNDYLPFKVSNPKNPGKVITLQHLLSHSSGIVDKTYAGLVLEEFIAPEKDHPMTIAAFIRDMLDPAGKYYHPDTFLDDRAGAVYSYSNVGATLAAYMVECVSRESFDTRTTREFIAPLHTTTLVWHLRDYVSQPFAVPHDSNGQPLGNYSMVDYCTGGLHGNLADMSVFAQLIVNRGVKDGKEVIAPAILDAMGKVQYPEVKSTQGLFWENVPFKNLHIYGHMGDVPGSHSMLYANPSAKKAVIVLYNGDVKEAQFPEINKLLNLLLEL